MNAQQRLALVMEVAATRRQLAIAEYQVDASMQMFAKILELALERDPALHAAIIELFEQDMKERENAMGSDDVNDVLRSHDSKTGSAAAQGSDQPGGAGERP